MNIADNLIIQTWYQNRRSKWKKQSTSKHIVQTIDAITESEKYKCRERSFNSINNTDPWRKYSYDFSFDQLYSLEKSFQVLKYPTKIETYLKIN